MKTILYPETSNPLIPRHRSLAGIIELLIRRIELSPEALERAQEHYAEKTLHLQGCPWLSRYELHLSPHGSAATNTTVAPLARKHGEHDVDLVLKVIAPQTEFTVSELHRRVGDRLKSAYEPLLHPIRFGWMLDYGKTERFHFDVIAAIPWLHRDGRKMAAAADTREGQWKPTNPAEFAKEFLALGERLPLIEDPEYRRRLNELVVFSNSRAATVVPLPENTLLKTPLQRGVQLTKRFRDVWFAQRDRLKQRTPSIIITTLMWRAYETYVAERSFPSMFAVLETLAAHLDDPAVLRVEENASGGRHFSLLNPTVFDENLVARWNEAGRSGEADEFYAWVRDYRQFLKALGSADGLHRLEPLLNGGLGAQDTAPVLREINEAMRPSPRRSPVYHAPAFGLTTSAAAAYTPSRSHTFDGHQG